MAPTGQHLRNGLSGQYDARTNRTLAGPPMRDTPEPAPLADKAPSRGAVVGEWKPATAPKAPPTTHKDTGAEYRRAKFVRAYLENGNNGAQAAISAGYSVRTARITASRLLTLDSVKRSLAAEIAAKEAAHGVTADFVLGRLKLESEQAETPAARVAALHLLAKHLGLFAPDQHNHQFVGTLFAQAALKDEDDEA